MLSTSLSRNTLLSIIQVIFTGIALFFFYKFIFKTLGAVDIGVWSVIISITSSSKLGEMGFGASTTKFVAKYFSNDKKKASRIIQTSFLSIGLFVLSLCAILYPFLFSFIKGVVPRQYLDHLAINLLICMFTVWVSSLASVYLASIDGCNRIDIRSILVMLATFVNFVLAFLLLPRYGLMALFISQLIQATFTLLAGAITLKILFRDSPIFPVVWDKTVFFELFGYGAKFQLINISSLLFDPVTKTLLATAGAFDIAGYFEMATRMLIQLKSVLVSVAQAFVPRVSELEEIKSERIHQEYRDAYQIMAKISPVFFAFVILSSPLISYIWVGQYQEKFVLFSVLLSIAFWINAISSIPYFFSFGTGKLQWCIISNLSITVSNFVLGVVGATYGIGIAVIFANCASILIGSLVMIYGYNFQNQYFESKYFFSGVVKLSFIYILASVAFFYYFKGANVGYSEAILTPFGYLIVFIVFLFRSQYIRQIRNGLVRLAEYKP